MATRLLFRWAAVVVLQLPRRHYSFATAARKLQQPQAASTDFE